MLRMWFRKHTIGAGITVAGLFLVSDASNFFGCANWLLDYGKVGNIWCERRPLYPAILAGISGVTARVWLVTMLAQAVLVTLCARQLFVHAVRIGHRRPALVCGIQRSFSCRRAGARRRDRRCARDLSLGIRRHPTAASGSEALCGNC